MPNGLAENPFNSISAVFRQFDLKSFQTYAKRFGPNLNSALLAYSKIGIKSLNFYAKWFISV